MLKSPPGVNLTLRPELLNRRFLKLKKQKQKKHPTKGGGTEDFSKGVQKKSTQENDKSNPVSFSISRLHYAHVFIQVWTI